MRQLVAPPSCHFLDLEADGVEGEVIAEKMGQEEDKQDELQKRVEEEGMPHSS